MIPFSLWKQTWKFMTTTSLPNPTPPPLPPSTVSLISCKAADTSNTSIIHSSWHYLNNEFRMLNLFLTVLPYIFFSTGNFSKNPLLKPRGPEPTNKDHFSIITLPPPHVLWSVHKEFGNVPYVIVTEEHRHRFVLLVISQVAQAHSCCVSTIA